MEFTAKQIALLINGTIEGDPNIIINDISKIENGHKGSLAFLANPKYAKYIYSTNASVIIINNDFQLEKDLDKTLIRVEDPYSSFAKLLREYQKYTKVEKKGISEKAHIEKSAKIGKNVYIGPFVYIGENVEIGDHVKIYPNTLIEEKCKIGENTIIRSGVNIYEDCIIGKNCEIYAGVVIGSDGFGFAPNQANNYKKVPQMGNVIIEDNVDIGANCTIDRATLGSTIIKKGVKLDNLIQIAHNVEIGENTVICAQAGIAGSSKIGKDCIIAGQAGVINHLEIGDNVKIAAQSGVTRNLKNDSIVQGSAAFDFTQYQKVYVIFRKLPELRKQIDDLQKKIDDLESQLNNK